jgi:hypothetical protein
MADISHSWSRSSSFLHTRKRVCFCTNARPKFPDAAVTRTQLLVFWVFSILLLLFCCFFLLGVESSYSTHKWSCNCSCPCATFGRNMERSGFGTSWGQVSFSDCLLILIRCFRVCESVKNSRKTWWVVCAEFQFPNPSFTMCCRVESFCFSL